VKEMDDIGAEQARAWAAYCWGRDMTSVARIEADSAPHFAAAAVRGFRAGGDGAGRLREAAWAVLSYAWHSVPYTDGEWQKLLRDLGDVIGLVPAKENDGQ
jgi:hypothetical protein